MGKYDNLDRDYFTEPEHLAELISNGVYRKKLRIEPSDLEMLGCKYPSLAGSSGSLERDGICLCRSQGIKYGLEIENYPDYGMPRRILVYDASEYEREAAEIRHRHEKAKDLKDFAERKSGMTKDESFCPVISMVLYLGQGHYRGRRTLRECFRIPEKLKPLVSDRIQNYAFCVIEADHADPQDYRTELRQFFQVMQCRNDREKLAQLFETEEFQNLSTLTQKVIAVHLGNKKIEKKVMEEDQSMCKALRDWEREVKREGKKEGMLEGKKEGILEGKKEGMREGKREGLLYALKNLMEYSQLTVEQAMDILKITGEERTALKALL